VDEDSRKKMQIHSRSFVSSDSSVSPFVNKLLFKNLCSLSSALAVECVQTEAVRFRTCGVLPVLLNDFETKRKVRQLVVANPLSIGSNVTKK
jgi:hypothetical protein